MIRKLLVLTATVAAAAFAAGAAADQASATDIAPAPIVRPDTRPDIAFLQTNAFGVVGVTNAGSTATGLFNLKVAAWGSFPNTYVWWTPYIYLGPGQSLWLSIYNSILPGPPCGFMVTADPGNLVNEPNETNNVYYRSIC